MGLVLYPFLAACSPPGGGRVWLEAESGAVYSPMVIRADPGASQRIYLSSWKEPDYTARDSDDGRVIFPLSAPSAGTWSLWARVRGGDGRSPYDVSIDGTGDPADDTQWRAWTALEAGEDWRWVDTGVSLPLSAGEHILRLIPRAGGPSVHLDRLLLTSTRRDVPEGLGEPAPVPTRRNPYRSDVVDRYGQLRVEDGAIVSAAGQPVQLRGLGLHGLQWFPLTIGQTIPDAVEFFGAQILRPAMYIEDISPMDPADWWGGYLADPVYMQELEAAAIEDAIQAGVYVIIDWHIHSDPSHHTDEAVAFFSEQARRYGHLPNVIYEICNEPVGVGWSDVIRPYAETVIPAIREHDPDNIVLVGSPNWSQDLDAVAADPLSPALGNVAYTHHFYAGGHDLPTMQGKVQAALDAELAVFASEWSPANYEVNRVDYAAADKWIAFLNKNRIGWSMWGLTNKDESSSLLLPSASLTGPWSEADLTETGRWVRALLLEAQTR